MSQSDRKRTSRSLRFESLEMRKSLTSVSSAVDDVTFAEASVAEISTTAHAESTLRFLSYIASLDNISVEHATPDQADADAVDQLIAENLPGSLG